MKKYMMIIQGFLAAALIAGCASPPENYTDETVEAFLARAQNPRRFGLTMYAGKAGPVFAGSFRLHAGQFAKIPMHRGEPVSLPTIKIQGRTKDTFTALLDTSSRANWMTLQAASEMIVFPLSPVNPFQRIPEHVVAPGIGFLGLARKLQIDTLHIENAIMYILLPEARLGPLARGITKPDVDVVLGGDLLKQFTFVQLDYPQRQVILASNQPYKPNAKKLVGQAPLREVAEGVMAGEGIIDGIRSPIIFDTAGSFSVAVPDPAPTEITQLTFGDMVFRRVPARSTRALQLGFAQFPRIGTEILSRYVITLDNRKKTIYFEKP